MIVFCESDRHASVIESFATSLDARDRADRAHLSHGSARESTVHRDMVIDRVSIHTPALRPLSKRIFALLEGHPLPRWNPSGQKLAKRRLRVQTIYPCDDELIQCQHIPPTVDFPEVMPGWLGATLVAESH